MYVEVFIVLWKFFVQSLFWALPSLAIMLSRNCSNSLRCVWWGKLLSSFSGNRGRERGEREREERVEQRRRWDVGSEGREEREEKREIGVPKIFRNILIAWQPPNMCHILITSPCGLLNQHLNIQGPFIQSITGKIYHY